VHQEIGIRLPEASRPALCIRVRRQEGSGKPGGLKLNGTLQLAVYADRVNVLGGSERTVEKNTETSVVASKVIGLKSNADKTKYMVMSRDQNAGRS
jgi:hypothetical protein